jgi:hypothetical protein
MSPASPVETFLDRLRIEHADLKDRIKKPNSFLDSQAFNALHWTDQHDLERQYGIMVRLLSVLDRRLNRAGINAATGG